MSCMNRDRHCHRHHQQSLKIAFLQDSPASQLLPVVGKVTGILDLGEMRGGVRSLSIGQVVTPAVSQGHLVSPCPTPPLLPFRGEFVRPSLSLLFSHPQECLAHGRPLTVTVTGRTGAGQSGIFLTFHYLTSSGIRPLSKARAWGLTDTCQ